MRRIEGEGPVGQRKTEGVERRVKTEGWIRGDGG